MLNCKDATHRMSEAEDRELGLGERVELSIHLAMCKGCRNYQQHLHILRDACRGYREHLLGTDGDLLRPERKGES
ncbi:zf-HC2 domain-containing protein [Azonexus sp.]|uniref:zf-HC2 domain-containing protein n=1 Tax=Azonexus sp. TaxID=1872668 RepID=UPI0027BA37CF|nr:zf-HC2 domain-containing protein [Azonexus sp.]